MSADGRQFVYSQLRSTTDFETQDRTSQLLLASRDLGTPSRVIVDNPEYTYINPTGWSADGRSVLVEIERRDATWQIAWVSLGDGKVTVVKSLNWRHRREFADRPALSPDGKFIAYSALVNERSSATAPVTAPGMRVYLLAADGSSESPLTEPAGYYGYPVWSRDGTRVLFLSDRRSGRPTELDLLAVSVRDGRTAGTPSLAKPNIGRAGTMLLGMAANGSLFYNVLPLAGGRGAASFQQVAVEDLSRSGAGATSSRTMLGFGWSPSWSPDGRSIAFRRSADDAVVVRSLSSGAERTYPEWSHAGDLAWLSDGSGLASIVVDNGRNRLAVHHWDLASGVSRQVFDIATPGLVLNEGGFILSLDQKVGYFFADDERPGSGGRIVSIDLENGRQREVWRRSTVSMGSSSRMALSPDGMALSPDGTTLAFMLCACGPLALAAGPPVHMQLATVSVNGTGYREVYGPFRRAPSSAAPLIWTNDGHAIFAAAEGNRNGLMRIDIRGGKPEPLGFVMDGVSGQPKVNRDGTRVAYRFRPSNVTELWSLDLSRLLDRMP